MKLMSYFLALVQHRVKMVMRLSTVFILQTGTLKILQHFPPLHLENDIVVNSC